MRPARVPFKNIVQAVLSVTEPAAIILFGYHAGGEAREESDVDLLVFAEAILNLEKARKELGSLGRAIAVACDTPIDILLFTKSELNWKNTTNHMISAA
jgi:predicted nucleotidyltransferase